jgi:hypothetical protein
MRCILERGSAKTGGGPNDVEKIESRHKQQLCDLLF